MFLVSEIFVTCCKCVCTEMMAINDDADKQSGKHRRADVIDSHRAVSHKADGVSYRSEKVGAISYRHQNQREDKHNSDSRCERKKSSCYRETALKTEVQKTVRGYKTDSAARPVDVCAHKSGVQNIRRCETAERPNPNALQSKSCLNPSSESHTNETRKMSANVHSKSARPCTDDFGRNGRSGHLQQQHTAGADSRAALKPMQSDSSEPKPKLPEELVRAGWKLCWSKHRSRWYVFNTRTGTSSWDVPK